MGAYWVVVVIAAAVVVGDDDGVVVVVVVVFVVVVACACVSVCVCFLGGGFLGASWAVLAGRKPERATPPDMCQPSKRPLVLASEGFVWAVLHHGVAICGLIGVALGASLGVATRGSPLLGRS